MIKNEEENMIRLFKFQKIRYKRLQEKIIECV